MFCRVSHKPASHQTLTAQNCTVAFRTGHTFDGKSVMKMQRFRSTKSDQHKEKTKKQKSIKFITNHNCIQFTSHFDSIMHTIFKMRLANSLSGKWIIMITTSFHISHKNSNWIRVNCTSIEPNGNLFKCVNKCRCKPTINEMHRKIAVIMMRDVDGLMVLFLWCSLRCRLCVLFSLGNDVSIFALAKFQWFTLFQCLIGLA